MLQYDPQIRSNDREGMRPQVENEKRTRKTRHGVWSRNMDVKNRPRSGTRSIDTRNSPGVGKRNTDPKSEVMGIVMSTQESGPGVIPQIPGVVFEGQGKSVVRNGQD